jgi:hypothetical protein
MAAPAYYPSLPQNLAMAPPVQQPAQPSLDNLSKSDLVRLLAAQLSKGDLERQ